MKVGDHLFTTGNTDQYQDRAPGLGGRKKINLNQGTDEAHTKYIVNPTSLPDHSHAEIILLARFIRKVLTEGFTQRRLSLAGRRLPCGHCQQVINRFIVANKGEVSLDYVKAQQAGTLNINDAQVKDPQNYANALQHLTGIMTPEAIEQAYNDVPAVDFRTKAWLSRMAESVIPYVTRQVG